MKPIINKWAVAFRDINSVKTNSLRTFKRINDNYRYFIADPFLFEYQNTAYLFVELLDYKVGRGSIAYAKYDKEKQEFNEFKVIIQENYHLSYPLVFEFDSEIYMIPEANGSNSLYLYKAKHFPDNWEKHAVLLDNVKLVDTTPFVYEHQFYAITKDNTSPEGPMLLLKIDTDNWRVLKRKIVTNDVSISRPGGKVYQKDNKYYMVTQDCKDGYGTALNFLSFTIDEDMSLSYRLENKITTADVQIEKVKNAVGIHTFNFTNSIEVIDYKYPKLAMYRMLCRVNSIIKRNE